MVDNELYWAEKGKGAFLNGKRIHVSQEKKLKNSVVGLEFGYYERERDLKLFHRPLLNKVRYPYTLGGVASSVALVAKGMLDAYMHKALVWDFAAGAIIIEEAGGKVTNMGGNPIDWSGDWIEVVVSNGLIHNQILRALKK